jgi:hypothetical protein
VSCDDIHGSVNEFRGSPLSPELTMYLDSSQGKADVVLTHALAKRKKSGAATKIRAKNLTRRLEKRLARNASLHV